MSGLETVGVVRIVIGLLLTLILVIKGLVRVGGLVMLGLMLAVVVVVVVAVVRLTEGGTLEGRVMTIFFMVGEVLMLLDLRSVLVMLVE